MRFWKKAGQGMNPVCERLHPRVAFPFYLDYRKTVKVMVWSVGQICILTYDSNQGGWNSLHFKFFHSLEEKTYKGTGLSHTLNLLKSCYTCDIHPFICLRMGSLNVIFWTREWAFEFKENRNFLESWITLQFSRNALYHEANLLAIWEPQHFLSGPHTE